MNRHNLRIVIWDLLLSLAVRDSEQTIHGEEKGRGMHKAARNSVAVVVAMKGEGGVREGGKVRSFWVKELEIWACGAGGTGARERSWQGDSEGPGVFGKVHEDCGRVWPRRRRTFL